MSNDCRFSFLVGEASGSLMAGASQVPFATNRFDAVRILSHLGYRGEVILVDDFYPEAARVMSKLENEMFSRFEGYMVPGLIVSLDPAPLAAAQVDAANRWLFGSTITLHRIGSFHELSGSPDADEFAAVARAVSILHAVTARGATPAVKLIVDRF